MKIFITGTAGFIGFHAAQRFLDEGHEVVGFDGFTDYYDPQLKRDRDRILRKSNRFICVEGMLENAELLMSTVHEHRPDIVIHFAAQAGVRYSIDHPSEYVSSNVQGTLNLLEAIRQNRPKHFLFASTSSVYGGNTSFPFEENARTAFPLSLYAATKTASESMTHSYSSLFDIPTTCFRFFTVYGPWGRPDMALFKFVDRIQDGKEIEVYGNGEMSRDFTYIDDLIEAVVRLSRLAPTDGRLAERSRDRALGSPVAPWRVVNIAGGQPVPLMDFITSIEEALGVRAAKKMLPMQPGDVTHTLANSELLYSLTGFTPHTPIDLGVKKFVQWYIGYQRGIL